MGSRALQQWVEQTLGAALVLLIVLYILTTDFALRSIVLF